jgi:hypothetical protein
MPYKFNPFTGNLDEIPSSKIEKSVFSTVSSASANWNSVYSTVSSKSATEWDNQLAIDYTHQNFLPLSGGIVTGDLAVLAGLSANSITLSSYTITNEIVSDPPDDISQITTTNSFLTVIMPNGTYKYLRLYDLDVPYYWITGTGEEIVTELDEDLLL